MIQLQTKQKRTLVLLERGKVKSPATTEDFIKNYSIQNLKHTTKKLLTDSDLLKQWTQEHFGIC